jgi:aspartyl/asparaginyl beta-hydroxylase (cupin superfamily)
MAIGVTITVPALILIGLWLWEARIFLYLYERLAYPIYRTPAFLDNLEYFLPQYEEIARSLPDIRREFLDYFQTDAKIPKAHEIDQYNIPISSADGPAWRTLYLKVYNGWFEKNVAKFPLTYALLKNMPNVTCVMFSVMEPGNVIPVHSGVMRGILRYQIPLVLSPQGECTIEVSGVRRQYRLGEPLMFDDNNPHTVSNFTDGARVILFLDVQKPSSTLVRLLDDFFMRLVVLSPKFKRASV